MVGVSSRSTPPKPRSSDKPARIRPTNTAYMSSTAESDAPKGKEQSVTKTGKSYKDCQSCGMPMRRDEKGGGTNADGSKNLMYRSHCFEAGKFTADHLRAGNANQGQRQTSGSRCSLRIRVATGAEGTQAGAMEERLNTMPERVGIYFLF